MTEFVVHADDFGISVEVNACIAECFDRGWLSETSLMVNMPACAAAVELARKQRFDHVVGLHLNLSEGFPLTKEIRVCKRFCNADGKFNKAFRASATGRFFFTSTEVEAVRKEIKAQMEKFCSFGGLMLRIDSHHHVHTDWSVYKILRPLALQYGFTSMRISADLHKVRLDKDIYKRFLNSQIRNHFKTTEHFDGICDGLLSDLGGCVEVMVHPMWRNGVIMDAKCPYERQMQRLSAIKGCQIRSCAKREP